MYFRQAHDIQNTWPDHIPPQMASDIVVKAGKMTITFPALNDLEEAGQKGICFFIKYTMYPYMNKCY